MGKITYQESSQYQNFKKTIESASKETEAFWNNSELSKEQVDVLVQKSNEIMEAMREQCLYVHKDYLAAANSNDYVTLESKNSSIKFALPMEKDSEEYVTEYYPIFGNSFGPFNSKEYFLSERRVLWLLKESFIEKESWVKGDRGGHDQAFEYVKDYFKYGTFGEKKETIPKIMDYTKELLNINFDNNKALLDDEIMKKVCILEVNHFPGLAFVTKNTHKKTSKKDYFKDWSVCNKEVISLLISFYNPTVIIFGSTLEYYEDSVDFDNFDDVFNNFRNNKLKIGDDKIIKWVCTHTVNDEVKKYDENPITSPKNVQRNIIYLGQSGKIYIQAYHPTYGGFKADLGKDDKDVVKNLIAS